MILTLTAFAAVGGYLVGSVPTAVIAARLAGRPDPRTVGTGNAGSSNVALTVGVRAGIAVFIIDLLKGALCAVAANQLAGPLAGQLAALGAAVGQVAPVFASLRGGKGVATTLGGYLGLDPALAVLGLAAWGAGLLLLRRFVIASVTAIAALAVVAALLQREPVFAIGALALTLVAHRGHLAAWRRGEMPTIGEALRDNRPTR